MGLEQLKYLPGIYRNGTRYQAKGRWYDASLMRFFDGAWRPVGGWSALQARIAGTVRGSDTCTDPNGTAITAHVPDSGFSGWEAGVGAFVAGASIQSNKIERTSVGSGLQEIHYFTATTLPYDNFEYYADFTRPADAANQHAGLMFRANGVAFSGVGEDGIFVYWDRVSSTLVNLRLFVIKNQVQVQTTLVASNVSWAASTELCLGVYVNGNVVEIFTAPAGTGATAITRTTQGTVTLTPQDLNSSSNRRFGLYLRCNATGYKFDNIGLKDPDPLADVPFSGVCRKLYAWRVEMNKPRLAIGTNTKIYTYAEEVLTDITPAGFTPGLAEPDTVVGYYGDGAYGAGPYGTGDLTSAERVEPASWQLDSLNEQLLGVCTSDGKLYRSVDGVTQMAACHGAPINNVGVVVTPEKFVVVLGAGGDPRGIAWCDQELVDDTDPGATGCWTPDTVNQAGDARVQSAGRLLCGKRMRAETLLFTDTDVFNMQYIGLPLVYSISQVGSNCGIISPHAVVVADNKVFWMGKNGFFVYDGYTHPLELDVSDYVFSDFNHDLDHKCFGLSIAAFNEVWFFYPSSDLTNTEPDRYVIISTTTGHATIGSLERTAGIDRGVFDDVFKASTATVLRHEFGTTMSGKASDEPFLESGPVELGNGDYVMAIKGFIPDEATAAGQVVGSSVAYLFTSFRPDETEIQSGPYTLAAKTDVRLSGRLARLRIQEAVRGDWRLGFVALDLEPASRR